MSLVSWLFERRGERAPSAAGGISRGAITRRASAPGGVRGGQVAVETMRRRHVRAIQAIEHQVYPRPWTLGIFQTEIDGMAGGDRHYVVARADGRLVGYAGMLFTLDEAHITNIAVDPAAHRSGVGTRLMLELLGEARARGVRAVSLEVRVSNVAAQRLYEGFGFATAGIRPKYYENVEDAMIMWCHGVDDPEYAERMRDFWARLGQA